ncbi:hypothetical protein [Rhodococcus sp. IEGM 1374]|uniref:hypothetical protein n=1 Tax=Rhodococcus sp. IEGM 1374 TaxID=3082221 RepID=UPI002953B5FC|nr:hypothetical protein [Rhodococcus sp. IEGM 1374]MDV7992060.1 hypothetical protein [Rhodococcus sp. IEGM 1374]
MEEVQYLDNVQRVLDLMRATFPQSKGPFKYFYYGDPEEIPVSNIPCLIVEMPSDETTRNAMSEDEVIENLVIKVVFNKADDWTNQIQDKDTTLYRIRLAIGMRDLNTREYEPGTIKHAIRNALTDGLMAISDDVSVEYSTVLRSGGELPMVTAEAAVTVPIRYSVYVDETDPSQQI